MRNDARVAWVKGLFSLENSFRCALTPGMRSYLKAVLVAIASGERRTEGRRWQG